MTTAALETMLASLDRTLYASFHKCKEAVIKQYPFVQLGFQGANDHGFPHVDRVLRYARLILDSGFSAKTVSASELYILLMAVLFHDIGNLAKREGHAQLSVEYMHNHLGHEYSVVPDNFLDAICKVIQCHSNEEAIEAVIADPVVFIDYRDEARLQLLAAILRLADECDETYERAPREVYESLLTNNKMPEKSKIYWRFNQIIRVIMPRGDKREILVKMRFSNAERSEYYQTERGKRLLLGYAISRMEKLNGERKYCGQFLRQGAIVFDKVVVDIEFVGEEPLKLVLDDYARHNSTFQRILPRLLPNAYPWGDIPASMGLLQEIAFLLLEAFDAQLSAMVVFGEAGRHLDSPNATSDPEIRDIDIAVIHDGGVSATGVTQKCRDTGFAATERSGSIG